MEHSKRHNRRYFGPVAVGVLALGSYELARNSTSPTSPSAEHDPSEQSSAKLKLLHDASVRERDKPAEPEATPVLDRDKTTSEWEADYDQKHNAVIESERILLFSDLFEKLDAQKFTSLKVSIRSDEYIEYSSEIGMPLIKIFIDRSTGFFIIKLGLESYADHPKQLDENEVVQLLITMDKKISRLQAIPYDTNTYQTAADDISAVINELVYDPTSTATYSNSESFRSFSVPEDR